MSKVITFSRVFPSYHPKAGQPTYFVEKIWKSINEASVKHLDVPDISLHTFFECEPKHHTIRAINPKSKKPRIWKAGDWFSPRVWSGEPYNSKMIQFAPDIQIKKVWDFETDGCDFYINGNLAAYASSPSEMFLANLAANDGLQEQDLLDWFQFPKDFTGQIICWNETIEY